MSKILVSLAIMILAFTAVPVEAMAGELDGTQWKMRPEGWRGVLLFWQTDTLKFDAGKFESTACTPYGFMPGPYDSKREGDKVVWSATQTNNKGEKMEWQGTLSRDRLEGSYTWTKRNGKTMTIWWKAKKQA